MLFILFCMFSSSHFYHVVYVFIFLLILMGVNVRVSRISVSSSSSSRQVKAEKDLLKPFACLP